LNRDEVEMPKPGSDPFWAILRQRCPRCHQGKVFAGQFTMNRICPVCGLRFEREPGYFLGAMYFSYGIGVILIGALAGLVYLVRPDLALHWCVLMGWLLFLPLTPAVFRYSRVLWMHFDRHFDPGS
jgi:uncharacterized protein (DUF983 family)